MNNRNLKLCPFCGLNASVVTKRTGKLNDIKMYIHCHGCGCNFDDDTGTFHGNMGDYEYEQRIESLVKRWNRRTCTAGNE